MRKSERDWRKKKESERERRSVSSLTDLLTVQVRFLSHISYTKDCNLNFVSSDFGDLTRSKLRFQCDHVLE